MEPRFEFTFSYWIFAWFVLYYFRITSFNPKIWLVIALFINVFVEVYRISFTRFIRSWTDNLIYIVVDVIIKLIPIWIIRNTSVTLDDFFAGIGLFIVFVLWMMFLLGSIREIIQYGKDIQDKITLSLIDSIPIFQKVHFFIN